MPTHSGVSPSAIISSTSALKSVEGLGHLVALLLPDARDVPHERLEVGLERHAVLGAVDVGRTPGSSRPSSPTPTPRRRREPASTSPSWANWFELAGLREVGDVGRVAAEHLGVDLLLEVTAADVGDVDPVGLAELGQGVLHRTGLVLGVLDAEHRHRAGATGAWGRSASGVVVAPRCCRCRGATLRGRARVPRSCRCSRATRRGRPRRLGAAGVGRTVVVVLGATRCGDERERDR